MNILPLCLPERYLQPNLTMVTCISQAGGLLVGRRPQTPARDPSPLEEQTCPALSYPSGTWLVPP